jgi:DNA modification methylase
MDWRHIYDLISVAQKIYQEFKNLCVWNKTNAGMGTFYRSKHELVPVFKKGSATHINNFGLGQWGRHRSNVWDYAGANTLTRERLEQLALHPTVKPVAMIADAIKDCSRRGGLILDPFCGSGSTLLAAEITGRCCAAMELDPKYVDVTIRRWQKVTGEPAVDIDTGKTFDEQERKVLSKGGSRHGR